MEMKVPLKENIHKSVHEPLFCSVLYVWEHFKAAMII